MFPKLVSKKLNMAIFINQIIMFHYKLTKSLILNWEQKIFIKNQCEPKVKLYILYNYGKRIKTLTENNVSL